MVYCVKKLRYFQYYQSMYSSTATNVFGCGRRSVRRNEKATESLSPELLVRLAVVHCSGRNLHGCLSMHTLHARYRLDYLESKQHVLKKLCSRCVAATSRT